MDETIEADGYRIEPIDDRDEDDPDFEIKPILSSSNTDFGGKDPAEVREERAATFDPRRESHL
jgi:hypothetical protein